jgi:hypothetical protein
MGSFLIEEPEVMYCYCMFFQIVLLNPEFYHLEMKPVVAEWTHLWLESQHVSGNSCQ